MTTDTDTIAILQNNIADIHVLLKDMGKDIQELKREMKILEANANITPDDGGWQEPLVE